MMLNPEWGVLPKKARHVPTDDIAMSCRVRLARNLVGERFPDWATEHDRERVFAGVREALRVEAPDLRVEPVAGFEEQDRDVLCESHLISKDLLDRAAGGGVAYAVDGSVCVMINEEDHLRIQVLRAGFQLKKAWNAINDLDTALEDQLDYAFSPTLGYMTACPTNLGTAMRASVMLHLPALTRCGQISRLANTVSKLGLTIRGAYGEGTAPKGDIYQLSNQITLGITESAALDNLQSIALQLVTQEREAARRMVKSPEESDRIWRALGVLKTARLLSGDEFMELISLVRLGAAANLIGIGLEPLNELIVNMQPATINARTGGNLQAAERDAIRAQEVREALKDAQ